MVPCPSPREVALLPGAVAASSSSWSYICEGLLSFLLSVTEEDQVGKGESQKNYTGNVSGKDGEGRIACMMHRGNAALCVCSHVACTTQRQRQARGSCLCHEDDRSDFVDLLAL